MRRGSGRRRITALDEAREGAERVQGIVRDLKTFALAEDTKQAGERAGLGLSVCRGVVTALGGRIEEERTSARGTSFRVVLPPPSRRTRLRSGALGLEEHGGSRFRCPTHRRRGSVTVVKVERVHIRNFKGIRELDWDSARSPWPPA